MSTPSKSHFDIQITGSAAEIAPEAWDAVSRQAPFQSQRWYRFGEVVMTDCRSTYLTLLEDSRPVARAALWLVREEPLQIGSARIRGIVEGYLRRRPLMICRSPLSAMAGLVLGPSVTLGLDSAERSRSAAETLVAAASDHARASGASFLVLDFLTPELSALSRKGLPLSEVAGPGTVMQLSWRSFDEFLAGLSKNERKHYRRTIRRAGELGINISRQRRVDRLPEALALIRNMERRFKSAPNPWMSGMMEHLGMVESTWLAATIGERLVGCELVLQDNGGQMVTALGLADDVPYAYFALGYEDIRLAIETGMHTLYWGSGAYEVKERLGFSLYPNNLVAFAGFGPVPRLTARVASAFS